VLKSLAGGLKLPGHERFAPGGPSGGVAAWLGMAWWMRDIAG